MLKERYMMKFPCEILDLIAAYVPDKCKIKGSEITYSKYSICEKSLIKGYAFDYMTIKKDPTYKGKVAVKILVCYDIEDLAKCLEIVDMNYLKHLIYRGSKNTDYQKAYDLLSQAHHLKEIIISFEAENEDLTLFRDLFANGHCPHTLYIVSKFLPQFNNIYGIKKLKLSTVDDDKFNHANILKMIIPAFPVLEKLEINIYHKFPLKELDHYFNIYHMMNLKSLMIRMTPVDVIECETEIYEICDDTLILKCVRILSAKDLEYLDSFNGKIEIQGVTEFGCFIDACNYNPREDSPFYPAVEIAYFTSLFQSSFATATKIFKLCTNIQKWYIENIHELSYLNTIHNITNVISLDMTNCREPKTDEHCYIQHLKASKIELSYSSKIFDLISIAFGESNNSTPLYEYLDTLTIKIGNVYQKKDGTYYIPTFDTCYIDTTPLEVIENTIKFLKKFSEKGKMIKLKDKYYESTIILDHSQIVNSAKKDKYLINLIQEISDNCKIIFKRRNFYDKIKFPAIDMFAVLEQLFLS